jgi:hypothetical protein
MGSRYLRQIDYSFKKSYYLGIVDYRHGQISATFIFLRIDVVRWLIDPLSHI